MINQKYKEYLEQAAIFQGAVENATPSKQQASEFLEAFFTNEKESFQQGAFLGKSVIDELDAKQVLICILEIALDEQQDQLIALLRSDKLKKSEVSKLHAMLAGYITSLLK